MQEALNSFGSRSVTSQLQIAKQISQLLKEQVPDLAATKALDAVIGDLEHDYFLSFKNEMLSNPRIRRREKLLLGVIQSVRERLPAPLMEAVNVLLLSSEAEANQPKGLQAPAKLEAEEENSRGEINIRWKRVYGAKAYLIEMTSNPTDPEGWKQVQKTICNRSTVENPAENQPVFVRISAIGEDGKSQSSEIQIRKTG